MVSAPRTSAGPGLTGPIHPCPPAGSARDALLPELLAWALTKGAAWIGLEFHPDEPLLIVTQDGAGVTDPFDWWTDSSVAFLARPLAGRLELISAFGELLAPCTEGMPVHRPRRTAWDGTTTLVLHGVTLTEHRQESLAEAEFRGRLQRLAFGFPLTVTLNGRERPRPHAATGARLFLQTDLGLIALAGYGPGEDWQREFTTDLAVYVQGLPVFAPAFGRTDGLVNIVHLDPARCLAVWPERHRLVDEDAALRAIRRAIRHLWQVRLAKLKEEFSPDDFVRGYAALRTCGAPGLLRDVPFIPAPLLARFSGIPRWSVTDADEVLEVLENPLSHADLERGRVRLGRLESPDESGDGFLRRLWAWQLGLVLIDDELNALPKDHWVGPFEQLDLDAAPLQVELLDRATTEVYDSPVFGKVEVRCCRAYRLILDGEPVEIATTGVYWAAERAVLLPAGETSGQVVRQIADFREDDDRVDLEATLREERLFRLFVANIRTPEAVATLRALLASCPLRNYPALRGRRFRLMIDAGGDLAIETD